jgi:2-phosphoglycerate kinase
MEENIHLKEKLSHVLFLGGGTDAGKTTVARMLAEKHDWQLYRFDLNEMAHIERLLEKGSKYYDDFMAMSEDERWVLRTPEEMAAGTIGGWSERAVNNHFSRDMLMTDHIMEQAERLGLTVITVDGSLSVEGVAELVKAHFGRYLSQNNLEPISLPNASTM